MWGYIQTLANLVGDWKVNEQGFAWWGDKGIMNIDDDCQIRQPRKSPRKEDLGEIDLNSLYGDGRTLRR